MEESDFGFIVKFQDVVAPQEQNLEYRWVYQLEQLSTVQITLVS
jgi:hypothetical protein